MTDAAAVPLRDAATLMLVRDGETGLEVFMMRRTLSAAFVAGFYVFPGGAVDTADRDESLAVHVVGRNDRDASRALGIESGGLASWVAALRECFEEAGVLLAVDADGSPIGFDDPDVARRYLGHRAALHRGELTLADLCSSEGIRLAADRLYYVSHWITPVGEPRRFDTRFFLAATPLNQEPLHDDNETIASLWVNPAEALAMHHRGDLQLIAPTIRNLQFLVPHVKAADVLAAAAAVVDPPPMFPRLLRDGNGFHILLPGDAGYEDAS